jgi:hypothetical protein
MNGYVTPARFYRVMNLPISFPQTEMRRGNRIVIAQMPVDLGQILTLRALTLHVVSNLSPGQVPVYHTTSLGAISVGLYFGSALTSPLALATLNTVGTSMTNPFHATKCVSPGVYTVVVSNNTSNMDFSVVVTGATKLYL